MLKLLIRASPFFLAVNITFSVIAAVISPITLLFYRNMMENAISAQPDTGAIILHILLYFAFSAAAMWTSSYIQSRTNPIIEVKVQRYVTKILYNKIPDIDLGAYDDTEFYDKYTRAAGEAGVRALAVGNTVVALVASAIAVFSIGAMVGSISRIFFVFVAAYILNSLIIVSFQNNVTFKQQMEMTQPLRKAGYVGRVFYLPDYAKELRIFGVGNKLVDLYSNVADEQIGVIKKYSKKFITINYIGILFSQLIEAGMIFTISMLIIGHKVSVSEFVVIIVAVQQLAIRFSELVRTLPSIKLHSQFIDNFLTVINYKSKLATDNSISLSELSAPETTPLIEFENVSFKYQSSPFAALNRVNIRIPGKRKIAIVGTNGAGKSTLLKLLLRLYDPTNGKVKYSGTEYTKLADEEIRKKFAVVFQDSQHYSLTIAENVLMREVVGDDDLKLIWRALKMSGLQERVRRLPSGVNTILTKEFDDNGVVFSGGELQKLAIARAYAQESEIVIMDEPTSSLDPVSEDEIFKRMLELCEDKTVIFVSHKLSLATYADYIYVMDEGRIVEQGTHRKLMDDGGQYAEMYATQSRNYVRPE
jgi:ATP-binding cassette subfamily B protein